MSVAVGVGAGVLLLGKTLGSEGRIVLPGSQRGEQRAAGTAARGGELGGGQVRGRGDGLLGGGQGGGWQPVFRLLLPLPLPPLLQALSGIAPDHFSPLMAGQCASSRHISPATYPHS